MHEILLIWRVEATAASTPQIRSLTCSSRKAPAMAVCSLAQHVVHTTTYLLTLSALSHIFLFYTCTLQDFSSHHVERRAHEPQLDSTGAGAGYSRGPGCARRSSRRRSYSPTGNKKLYIADDVLLTPKRLSSTSLTRTYPQTFICSSNTHYWCF